MADAKITALSAIGAMALEDLIALVDDPSGTPASVKGTLTQLLALLVGDNSIFIPAIAMVPRVTTVPSTLVSQEIATSLVPLWTMDFDTATNQFCGFGTVLPKSWNAGTITAIFYWTTDGTQTGGLDGVRWAIRGGSYASSDLLTTALGTAVAVDQDHSATAWDLMITAATAAVTIAGSGVAGEFQWFEIYRNTAHANDDLDTDAKLLGVEFKYTADALNDD